MKLVSFLNDIPYPSAMGKYPSVKEQFKPTALEDQGGEFMYFPMALSLLIGECYSNKVFWRRTVKQPLVLQSLYFRHLS